MFYIYSHIANALYQIFSWPYRENVLNFMSIFKTFLSSHKTLIMPHIIVLMRAPGITYFQFSFSQFLPQWTTNLMLACLRVLLHDDDAYLLALDVECLFLGIQIRLCIYILLRQVLQRERDTSFQMCTHYYHENKNNKCYCLWIK